MRECPACKLCFPDDINHCPIDGDATFHSISGEPILEGKYQLEKRLGQGGMGVVYKARHNFLKTAHAIKVILPDLVGNDPNLVTRFRQEAIAAAAIRHRNIVSVSDFGVVAGKMPFLVMEFVQGETLHDMLVREKRLPSAVALEILSSICSGLAAAHRQGIVHRDLKPLNVIIQQGASLDDGVKILDFGLAKIKSGELLGSFIQAQTTGLMGSPFYMAPEQWSDDEPDVRADVYSLGVMLFQMLAGDVPFKGASIPAIMKKHLTDPPPSFAQVGLNDAPAIEAVVAHALEKDLNRRTQSVEELVTELRQAVQGTSAANVINISSGDLTANTLEAKKPQPTGNITVPPKSIDNAPPLTTLQIFTNPPQAKVFLDGKPLGTSEANGWLVVEKIARGGHQLKVVSDGFIESESVINCDNEVFQTVVQLRSLLATNVVETPKPQGTVSAKNNQVATNAPDTMVNLTATENKGEIALEAGSNAGSQAQNVGIRSYPEPKFEKTNPATKQNTLKSVNLTTFDEAPVIKPAKSNFLMLVMVGAGALILLVLVGVGIVAVQFIPRNNGNSNSIVTAPPPIASPGASPIPILPSTKAELIKIDGGTFQMGRNEGQSAAQPAHSVTVKSFMMDKTEVTNAEYAEFVAATGHREPEYFVNQKPLPEEISLPVVAVALSDAKAFAKWRSERDGTTYRLPTEEEWEYAARNGAEASLYPWGNNWADERAVIEVSAPLPAGSLQKGANKWGVTDLIGNVWEWTDTPLKVYKGSTGVIKSSTVPEYIIRGGSVKSSKDGDNPITSAHRHWVDSTRRDKLLGFRLVGEISN